MKRTSCLVLLLVCLLGWWQDPAAGAIVSFTSSPITGDPSDISTNGTLKRAYNFAQPAAGTATINGVDFLPTNTNAKPGHILLFPNGFSLVGDRGSGAAPYTTADPDYQTLLRTIVFVGGGDDLTLRVSELTVGEQYEIQMFFNDSRPPATPFSVDVIAGNSINVLYNNGQVAGALGNIVTGTFVADAVTQSFLLDAPGTQTNALNAYQLRHILVPEPASISVAALGAVAVAGAAWRRHRRRRASV